MNSSFMDQIQSSVDNNIQLMEGYNQTMAKLNREILRRKLESGRVSPEEIASLKVKFEAMDDMVNLFEKHSNITTSFRKTLAPSSGSERDDEEKPVVRKVGFAGTLDEILKEVEKNRKLIPDKQSASASTSSSSSFSDRRDLEMMAGKFSVLGMGGIGETIIHNNDSTNNYSFGKVQLTNHYYYKKKMDDSD